MTFISPREHTSRKNFFKVKKQKKNKKAVGFEGSQDSMLRKLKSIGLKSESFFLSE